MLIRKITLSSPYNRLNFSNGESKNTKQFDNNTNMTNTISQLPSFTYGNYDISFGARLFRTPANFYAQPFNQKGMPDTMKAYLNEDYSDRQNMPPYQMLRLVFDDLNETKNLEQVKRIFPDEPLFADLTDTPNRNVKKGLVSEVEALRDETDSVPLFKDGESNFGLYLLRKIYLEGKTMKEIQSDFKKDVTPLYAELIDNELDYSDINAYGIKFPNNAFWKSFTANRENFPYVYKPRKATAHTSAGANNSSRIRGEEHNMPPRQPKFKLGSYEVNKMTDAFVAGRGSRKNTEKNLKHRGVKDPEKLSFVSKYFSEIMSVSLEKIHASEEMRYFFEHSDDLTKKQKEKFEAYWRSNPRMRELQSMAISDTIKLFFEAYGADGNNEEFQDLLAYAASIKPNREKQLEEHNKRQAEYEEIFANYVDETAQTDAPEVPAVVEEKKVSKEEIDARLREEALKNGAEVFNFESPDGQKYSFVCNIDETFADNLKREMNLLPNAFINRYLRFMLSSPLATYDYKKSIALMAAVPPFAKEQLMQPDEYRHISSSINKDFSEANRNVLYANDLAFAERILSRLNWDPKFAMMIAFDTSKMLDFATMTLKIDDWTPAERQKLDADYREYLQPIKSKADINNVTNQMVDYLVKLDPDSVAKDDKNSNVFCDDLMGLTAANVKDIPAAKNMVAKVIRQTKFLDAYGGTAKILLKPDVPQEVKDVKLTLMLEDLFLRNSSDLIPVWTMSSQNIRKYVKDPSLESLLFAKSFRMNRKKN